jgi:transcriptional regulator with XRE-family HTH domain
MSSNAFGPNLRRIRLQKGITIAQIAEITKISEDLLAGLERNDFSEWPAGIYARAYVRQYAYAIGVDPDTTVDEFCRCFPTGDRRAARIVHEHAQIVGHDLAWRDEVPASAERDRRGAASRAGAAARHTPSPLAALVIRLRRAFR